MLYLYFCEGRDGNAISCAMKYDHSHDDIHAKCKTFLVYFTDFKDGGSCISGTSESSMKEGGRVSLNCFTSLGNFFFFH